MLVGNLAAFIFCKKNYNWLTCNGLQNPEMQVHPATKCAELSEADSSLPEGVVNFSPFTNSFCLLQSRWKLYQL